MNRRELARAYVVQQRAFDKSLWESLRDFINVLCV